MISWLDLLLFFLLFILVATPKGKKPNNENAALAEVVVGAGANNPPIDETLKIRKAMDDYMSTQDSTERSKILKKERVQYSYIQCMSYTDNQI